jgi:hypothetical protein
MASKAWLLTMELQWLAQLRLDEICSLACRVLLPLCQLPNHWGSPIVPVWKDDVSTLCSLRSGWVCGGVDQPWSHCVQQWCSDSLSYSLAGTLNPSLGMHFSQLSGTCFNFRLQDLELGCFRFLLLPLQLNGQRALARLMASQSFQVTTSTDPLSHQRPAGTRARLAVSNHIGTRPHATGHKKYRRIANYPCIVRLLISGTGNWCKPYAYGVPTGRENLV